MAASEPEFHVNRMLALVIFNAATGGFLFGYDTSSISASLLQIRFPSTSTACPGLETDWLGSLALECITCFTVLGAFIASLFAGHINDAIGRRNVLLLSSITFASGALLMGIAWNVPSMLIARLIAGVGVGLSSHTMPCYVSECCPASIRGMAVLTGTIMIVLGQTAAAGFSAVMFSYEIPNGWRWILGVGSIPAALMYVGLWYFPESPRWLLSQGRGSEAKESLMLLRSSYESLSIEQEFQAMLGAVEEELSCIPSTPPEESKLTTLSKRYWKDAAVRRALLMGCCLQGLQQLIGINAIMYYGASVLVMASEPERGPMETCFSESDKSSVALSILLSAGQALGIITSALLVEHIGRRQLALTSLAGAVVGLCGVAASFSTDVVDKGLVIVFVLVFVYMFGTGMAGIPWLVNSEIYPLHVRSQCISIATATNWLMNFVVSYSFLTLATGLSTDRADPEHHPDGVFLLYAVIAMIGFVVLYFKMPETKGLTLEETSRLFLLDEEQKLL